MRQSPWLELWHVDLNSYKDLNVSGNSFSGGGFEEDGMRNRRYLKKERVRERKRETFSQVHRL